MYKATLICDADAGVLALREDEHPANKLAERAWQRWRERGSSSAVFEDLDLDLVDDYIRTQSIAPYFPDFYDFIAEHKILFGVVTQRMGRIVETILRRHGLDRIQVFANHIEVEPFSIRLGFPYFNVLGCDICPSCTLFHMQGFRRPGVPLIFIGEKAVHVCPAKAADLVFARGELRKSCEAMGLPFRPYATLRDVERTLMQMIVKGDLERISRKESDGINPPGRGADAGQAGQSPHS